MVSMLPVSGAEQLNTSEAYKWSRKSNFDERYTEEEQNKFKSCTVGKHRGARHTKPKDGSINLKKF